MLINVLKSKIHNATVTDANINYEGSITIGEKVMYHANIKDRELVHIWNITNGARIQTYAMKGPPDISTFCVNGAGAHLFKKDDRIIIASFALIDESEYDAFYSRVIIMKNNKLKILLKNSST